MLSFLIKKILRAGTRTNVRVSAKKRRVGAFSKSNDEYLKHKETTRVLVSNKLLEFNNHYNVSWKKVAIRNQRSRWGSCSRKGNLNFNFRLLFLPTHLQNYVIVHELCHLVELNHSANFWKRVSETMPNYKEYRLELSHLTKQGIRMEI